MGWKNLTPPKNVRLWPFASFRQDSEFGCYRGMADIVRLAV
jgi:hypothetical protein